MSTSRVEEEILNQLEWEKALQHITWLVNEAPGRHSGTEDEKKAANYIQETLSHYGLSVETYETDAYSGVPQDARLKIVEPTMQTIKCSPRAPTRSPISGEILCIESKEEAKEKYKDIEGKIVMVPSLVSYGLPITPEGVRQKGGRGFIHGNWGGKEHGALRVSAYQTQTYWGVPRLEEFERKEKEMLPQIYITRKDFEYLKTLCKKGTVKATFESRISSEWRKVHLVVAEVEGMDTVKDFAFIGGHFDSWFPGATDNAAGDALLMELARVFQNNRKHLRRNIRIGFWSGHESACYAASTWYLDHFWTEIDRHAVAYSAVDNPGFKDAPEYSVQVSEEIGDFVIGCARDVVGDNAILNVRRPSKTCDRGFFGIGLPSIYVYNAFSSRQLDEWHGAHLGWFNHSPYDTIDKIGEDNFVKTMRIRALVELRLCNCDVLPFDFIKVVGAFKKRLEEWERVAPRFDLGDTGTYVSRLDKKLQDLHETLESREFGEGDLRQVNTLLMKLCRTLIPINFTTAGRYSQDIFGTDLSKPLVAFKDIDELAFLRKGSPEESMLMAKLFKEKNRVNDGLIQGVSLIDAFLEK